MNFGTNLSVWNIVWIFINCQTWSPENSVICLIPKYVEANSCKLLTDLFWYLMRWAKKLWKLSLSLRYQSRLNVRITNLIWGLLPSMRRHYLHFSLKRLPAFSSLSINGRRRRRRWRSSIYTLCTLSHNSAVICGCSVFNSLICSFRSPKMQCIK